MQEKTQYWLTQIRKRQTGGNDRYDTERRQAIDEAMEALRKMEDYPEKPCDLCEYEDKDMPEICGSCPARKKVEADG